MYYAEAYNELAGPISASLHLQAAELLSTKYRNGGEPLATLCPIWPTRDLNLRPLAPETNALSLDLLWTMMGKWMTHLKTKMTL